MRLTFLSFCVVFCLFACSSESKPVEESGSRIPADSLVKFVTLDFEMDGQPCKASINTKYKNFAGKKEFPLSLFITVLTNEKDSLGFPTSKEEKVFQEIEDQILTGLGGEAKYCYVGRTTIPGYRDLIFFINPKNRKQSDGVLKSLQKKYSRISSITFEDDPDWEGVAEFYQAIM